VNPFFDGLEHSSSFSFIIEEGKPIPVKEVQYILFESDFVPFIVFSDELYSINDYCFSVATTIQNERNEAHEEMIIQRREQKSYDGGFLQLTPYETLMSIESRVRSWEWISNIMSVHLVVLLYAYLEKTLKYIKKWYVDEKIIEPRQNNSSTPKLFWLIYHILETDEDQFIQSAPHVYNVLEEARKMRNNFAHDNLEGKKLDNTEDYLYAERSFIPTFKLTELFDAVTLTLFYTEEVYKKKVKSSSETHE